MKKVLAVFLAVILAFSAVIPAFAADSRQFGEPEYPIVIIRGMDFSGLYTDYGTENEHSYLEKVNASNIIVAAVKALLIGFITKRSDNFADSLTVSLKDMFAEMACDGNGNSVANVSVVKYPGSFDNYIKSVSLGDYGEEGIVSAACDRYGAENVYYFTYDWRLDPYDIADEIHETVETAKADKDTDKVNLICASMGGVMTDAYIAKYGHDSLNSLMFLSSTFKGTYCTSDLLQGKAEVVESALLHMIKQSINAGTFMSAFLDTLNTSGVLAGVCKLGNNFIAKYKDKVYDGMLRDCFGTLPSLWALVLPEDFDNCINYMFDTPELKAKYSGVIDRAVRMNAIMQNVDDMLKEAQADGCKITVISSYNKNCVPFYDRADEHGDGTLESPLMLGGATMAKLGETLDPEYIAAHPDMISPDCIIDMSTCLFPESTWAVRNGSHVPCKSGSDFTEFMFELIDSPVQPAIDNMTEYSQFLSVDSNLDFVPFN